MSRIYDERTWQEFRETGLFLLVNQFLHIFGWALVVDFTQDEDGNWTEINKCYPARTNARGFSEGSTSKAYEKISRYMADSAQELLEEAKG